MKCNLFSPDTVYYPVQGVLTFESVVGLRCNNGYVPNDFSPLLSKELIVYTDLSVMISISHLRVFCIQC